MPAAVRYRESYVEKDRCVRNSTTVPVPGVDVYQGFAWSKTEFEKVFLQATETMDDPARLSNVDSEPSHASKPSTPSRLGRSRAKKKASSAASTPVRVPHHQPSNDASSAKRSDSLLSDQPSKLPSGNLNKMALNNTTSSSTNAPGPLLQNADDAAEYADVCRKRAANLHRSSPPDFHGAGELFEHACDTRASHGLFCTPENADAHVEYAQNLSKRGLTSESEYHLRTAADIYRMMNARSARKYGDVLLYIAVVVDRQERLPEAENFYRSALAVYRANRLSEDNVRVAIDSLSNNLRAQGRAEEVDGVIKRHFLGASD